MRPRLEHQPHVVALDLDPRREHVRQEAAPLPPARQVGRGELDVVRKRHVGRAGLGVDVLGVDAAAAALVGRHLDAPLGALLERRLQALVANVAVARRDGRAQLLRREGAVSYTHLTLPTSIQV